MQYQYDEKVDPHETSTKEASPGRSPAVTRRTPRMMYESSFATSAFTSSRNQLRPPGFMASSLDFALSSTDSTIEQNAVTIKPGKNKKIINKQKEEEQLQREKQYQQQRQYRPGHPTRAQGNFGPPPHSTRSLEDLENMSEEEIYKLFMDDPDFHQALLKTAETPEQNQNNVPSSTPVGAKKGRRSTGRKTSNSSNSKRSSAKSKTLKSKDVEREVPYFQWAFLFILIGTAIYKICRSLSISTTAKDCSDTSKKVIGRKNKKKKGGKPRIKMSGKRIVSEDKVQPSDKEKTFKKISSSRRKSKKKALTITPTLSSSARSDERNENDQTQKQDKKHDPDFDSTDGTSKKNEPEIAAEFDLAMQVKSGLTSSSIAEKDDEDWQTVIKSSKGGRKGNANVDPHILDQRSFENIDDGDVTFDQKTAESKNLGKQLAEDSKFSEKEKEEENKKVGYESSSKKFTSKNENENNSVAQPIISMTSRTGHVAEDSKIAYELTDGEKPDVISNGEYVKNDAALALKLQQEEENLARAGNGNSQEEMWEEVKIKKKRGI